MHATPDGTFASSQNHVLFACRRRSLIASHERQVLAASRFAHVSIMGARS